MSASLSGLTIGTLGLTPVFDPGVRDYTATTANTMDTVSATAEDPTAQVEIQVNGTVIQSGGVANWNAGANAVEVSATNGAESGQYSVAVTYTPPPPPDSRLSGLTIGSLTLTPAFDPDVAAYTAATTNATNTVTATPMDSAATVTLELDGAPLDSGNKAAWEDGDNELIVLSEIGGESSTYTVTVTKS